MPVACRNSRPPNFSPERTLAMQYRIFLIEDDPVIARTVRDYL